MHPIAEQARHAYAAGWAASGGPMTDRVRAGCAAAVALACEHADDPRILEATLELGSLEGTWAAIYARRQTIYDAKQAAVTAAVRALLAGVDLAPAIDRYRAAIGITEDERDDRKHREAEALAAILAVLHLAIADPDDPDYRTLLTTMNNTLRDGQAEGVAGAIAIAAEQAGIHGIDFELAYTEAHAELEAADYLATQAAAWIKEIIQGVARDVARPVADLPIDTTAEQTVIAAEKILDSGELPDVALLVDTAVSTAFSHGALGLYARLDVQRVDFMTAGDGRVCKRCTEAEADGPYVILNAPTPPVHPWCRCVQVPHNPLDPLLVAKYAMTG